METKKRQFFYKREVRILKEDLVALMKLKATGVAVKTIALDLIVEHQFQLTLDTLKDECSLLDISGDDVELTIKTYKDLDIVDGYIRSEYLDEVVNEDTEFRARKRYNAYETNVKKWEAKGLSLSQIARNNKIDLNPVLTENEPTIREYIIQKLTNNK